MHYIDGFRKCYDKNKTYKHVKEKIVQQTHQLRNGTTNKQEIIHTRKL